MRKKVTQKQKDQWKETQRKGVAKYQEKLRKKVLVPKKKSPVLKSSPNKVYKINKRTKKRAADERKYNARVRELKADPENVCQAKLKGCTGRFEHNHHKKGRIEELLLDESEWLFLCTNCHDIIEEKRKMAKEKGFSSYRLTRK